MDISLIGRLADEGKTIPEIAAELGTDYHTIYRAALRHGIRIPRVRGQGLRAPPSADDLRCFKSVSQMAKHYRIDTRTAKRWLAEKGVKLDPFSVSPKVQTLVEDKDGMLRRRLERELPHNLIAKQLGVTPSELMSAMRKRKRRGIQP
jgi:hypothetical protein